MVRVAIINHATHELIVEDIDEKVLEEHYNGEEEAYIKDNYVFQGEWSWDYITSAVYFGPNSDDPVDIEFEDCQ